MIKRYKKTVKKIRKISFKRKSLLFLVIPLIVVICLVVAFYLLIIKDLPSPTKLSNNTGSYSTQIYDRNGKLLYTLYGNRNQTFVPLAKIPKEMQEATIAIEDRDFYHHGAVDFRGIARALYSIVVHKEIQGGSTLTQQLVKNSLLTPKQTIQRKIREVILSFATEVMYNKNQILEMYLNQVPYGGTSYGVEAAAQTYFGKDINKLDLAQLAFLAALPEAPSTLSPYGSHPELGIERQHEVLQNMYAQGYISKDQMTKSLNEKLKFEKITNPIKAPHFVFYIRDLLEQKYGENAVDEGGFKVITSLDLNVQNMAQKVVEDQVASVAQYHVTNGAALVTDPATGEILAMVGSKDYYDPNGGNVNATIALLQPGSSIKPLNYALGLVNGYGASTPFIDAPICFPDPPNKPYCPHNYDLRYHGIVQMRYALANSYNIPAVEMLDLNGLVPFINLARQMGITTFTNPSDYGLSLTLGGGEVRMIDMATAYGVLANQGYRIDLHPILKITDRKGDVIEQYTPPASPIFGKKVLPSAVTFVLSNILADNQARVAEFGPNSALKVAGQYVSVKTGTTNDYRDNWTFGYTPSYLVSAWVGNNDHSAMSGIVTGITGAAPIFHDIMTNLLKGKQPEIPQKPSDVFGEYVCSTTGLIASKSGGGCPTRFEYLINGKNPKTPKITTAKVWVDKTTNAQAPAGDTNNVEQRDETVMMDSLGHQYCISCAVITPSPTP
ncbi:MAG TPA: transglycosylase domain-containing protein [Candidatus Saccharimonadales bacterium]|nr:transglycosylase domain-containing protein [Candidatus Saccharimonadales bacterium]